jgi:hypothetical protein
VLSDASWRGLQEAHDRLFRRRHGAVKDTNRAMPDSKHPMVVAIARERRGSARLDAIAAELDEALFNGSNARDYAGRTPGAGARMTEEAAMRDEIADHVLLIGVTD